MKAIFVNQNIIPKQTPLMECPICKSTQIVKAGKHYLKFKKVVQRYQCKLCGSSFSSTGYFKSRFPLQIIQHAIILYKEGFSLEQIQTEIKEKFNRKISRHGILNWLKKARIPRRQKSSGDQKNKKVREQIEIGFSAIIRFTSSEQPQQILLLHHTVFQKNGEHQDG